MKKHMLFTVTILILFFTFQDLFSQTVYITKSGKKYHSENCSSLRKSSIPIDLKDAVSRGYTACSRCNPPELSKKEATVREKSSSVSSTSTKSNVTSGRCQATTKKGTQCKRNARAGSKYCWQHGG